MSFELKIGMKGLFQLEAFKPILDAKGNIIGEIEGSRRELSPWNPNKLLVSGKNRIGSSSDWLNCCQVGDDGTLPTVNDTGLIGYVAGTSSVEETVTGAQGAVPWYGFKRIRYRFALGAVVGNIAEVGVGWSTANGAFLVSRALIVDLFGVPTVPTVQSDEVLDVNYEFRYYPPLADSTGTITLNGVVYNYTIRASEVNSSTAWALWIGTAVAAYGPFTSDWNAWTGTIGAITLGPNGSAYNADAAIWGQQAYANNSFERTLYFQCGPTGWNVAGGIRSISIKTTAGYYQAEFEAVSGGATIPKTTDYTMYTEWIISWVSATPEFTGTIGTQAWAVGVDPSFDVATYFGDPPGPLVFSILSGSLPTGTSVNASTGVIEGTPTLVETALCVIRCANDVGDAFTNEFSWSTT